MCEMSPVLGYMHVLGDAAAFESSTFLQVTLHPYIVNNSNKRIGSES